MKKYALGLYGCWYLSLVLLINIINIFLALYSNDGYAITLPSSANESTKNITDEQEELFNVDQNDIEVSKLIIDLYKNINNPKIQNAAIEKDLKFLKNIIKENTPFSFILTWIENRERIHKISNINDFENICSPLIAPTLADNDKKKVLGIQLKFQQQLEDYCVESLLNLANLEILLNQKNNFPVVSTVVKYFEVLLSQTYEKKFADHLKRINKNNKYIKELTKSFNDYLSNEKVFIKQNFLINSQTAKNLSLKIENSNLIQSIKNKNQVYENYKKELKLLSTDFKKYLKDENHLKLEVINKTLKLIKFFEKNHHYIKTEESLKEVMILGRYLIFQHYYNLSRQFFNIIIGLKSYDEYYYSAIFNTEWSFIREKKFNEAVKFIKSHNISIQDPKITSDIKFWMAHIYEQTKNKDEAIKIYERLIQDNPLSYYAIMSSRKIIDFSKNDKIYFDKEYLKKSFFSNDVSLINKNVQFTDEFQHSVKRILSFIKLGEFKFLNSEVKYLLSLEKEKVYANFSANEALKKLNDKGFLIQRALILSKILLSSPHHLQNFMIIQSAIENKEISFHRDLLISLFPNPYEKVIETHAKNKNVDPIIVKSLIRQESAYNPMARSRVGASGLMQIMYPTAKLLRKKIRPQELYQPEVSVELGVEYLKRLLNKYNGNLIYTLAAYNAGDRNLERWVKKIFTSDSMLETIESIPFQETKLYVKLIFRNIFFYQALHNQYQDFHEVHQKFEVALGLPIIEVAGAR